MTQGTITITPLNNSVAYMEDLGQARLYHQTWRIIGTIDTTSLTKRCDEIWQMKNNLLTSCQGKCQEITEIKLLRTRLTRTCNNIKLLDQITDVPSKKRKRRGLINFVGSLSKTLFGTLDASDLNYIDSEIDKLYNVTNSLAKGLTNQTHIIKLLLNNANNVNVRIISKMYNQRVEMNRDVKISNYLTMCGFLLADLQEDVNAITNAIGDAKHGIIHPQVFTPLNLVNGIKALEDSNHRAYSIENKIENYQVILDISNINILLSKKRLSYIIDIPVLEDDPYSVYHVIPIPIRKGKAYFIVLPENEFLLLDQNNRIMVPTDETTLNQCKRNNKNELICQRNQPSLLLSEAHTCTKQVIDRRKLEIEIDQCKTGLFKIKDISYIKMRNNQGYLMFPEETEVIDVLCGAKIDYFTIHDPVIVNSDQDCTLTTKGALIKIAPTKITQEAIYLRKTVNYPINISEINLISDSLETTRHELGSQEIAKLQTNLDTLQEQIELAQNQRRAHTWKETSLNILTYVGYTSIALTSLWLLNKIGAFDLVRKCIPNICINLFHVNNYPVLTQNNNYQQTLPEEISLTGVPPERCPAVKFRKNFQE